MRRSRTPSLQPPGSAAGRAASLGGDLEGLDLGAEEMGQFAGKSILFSALIASKLQSQD